jgi:hypothetical protein
MSKFYVIHDKETDDYWTNKEYMFEDGWSLDIEDAVRFTEEEKEKNDNNDWTKLNSWEEWIEVEE